ncbi:hypothetical protein JTE90_021695 [Oedothorax gibbosus]|uniref:Uncharacterized protein n=1 Tax=Oedothorax gibbosus TaxID=931172 RepID=A0AAV6TU78_9ARAC|nr:hypothetical protein JTE90_021695 [Oedothorax gibbosus]
MYVRGNRRDYDAWEREGRKGGRGWEDVFPYFLKSEDNTDPEIANYGYPAPMAYCQAKQTGYLSCKGQFAMEEGEALPKLFSFLPKTGRICILLTMPMLQSRHMA